MLHVIRVKGVVQGVGFRPFIYRLAHNYGLKGYVKNLSSAVEIVVSGEEGAIRAFLRDLKAKKPPLSRIDHISISINPLSLEEDSFHEFKIEKSKEEDEGGVVIPPDISICAECEKELFNRSNRRYLYPFTNCTNCGQRFSLIEKTPYDREYTSMRDFKMCKLCRSEYENPLDRRYHAQTTSCAACGPLYFLMSNSGERLYEGCEAIREAAKLLDEGKIIAIKGFGGLHIACKTEDEEVLRLRNLLRRKEQPFAIMARDVASLRGFSFLSKEEEKVITSFERPILVLRKKKPFPLSEYLAPGLHTIGVMLPYSPLHLVLFSFAQSSSFVMTSANLPDDPMVIDNEEALRKLRFVDYLLMHNLKIINRIDDSVIKFITGSPTFLRRSRGFVPLDVPSLIPINDKTTLSLGAELLNTFTIVKNGKATISQHIGNTSNYDVLLFMREAIERLKLLFKVDKFDRIFCDLHPRYNTTKLALEYGDKIYQVQHHFAHAFSLLGENKDKRAVVISCDGMGYGADGQIWGGEVLYVDLDEGEYERLGHLEYQKMLGGDLATYFPLRMAFSILRNIHDSAEFFERYAERLRYRGRELEVMEKQWKDEAIMTSSCGRVLDALSAILGICYERTYEGEPAMKLEAIAEEGKEREVLKMDIDISEEVEMREFVPYVEYEGRIRGKKGVVKVLSTTSLLGEAFEMWEGKKGRKERIAASFIYHLTKGLCEIAMEACEEFNVRNIGFSGGCAYNEMMTKVIRDEAKRKGLKFLRHEKVPAGDGGISFGQAVLSGIVDGF